MADRSIVRYADLLDALEYDPYPSAPRLDPLKAILACSTRRCFSPNRYH
jgi:hypothetical protein